MRSSKRLHWTVGFLTVAGLAACQGQIHDRDPETDGTTDVDPPLVCDAALYPAAVEGRLLTRPEYDNSVTRLLGSSERLASRDFPPENTVLGFENNARSHQATPLLVEGYIAAAETHAGTISGERQRELLDCESAQPERACALEFIDRFVKRAFRRPLEDGERDVFVKLFDDSTASESFEEAIQTVIQATLQSPQFLYRIDTLGAGTPTSETGAVQVGAWEMASRLSFFLTQTMPDDELLAAAEANKLSTAEEIEAQTRRLLREPEAREMTADFHRQWLHMDRFNGIVRDGSGLTNQAALADDWRTSLQAFLNDAFWEQGSVEAMFTSDSVFLNESLAPIYGETGLAAEFQVKALKHRSGLLTQPGLMALFSHSDQSAPIQRGVFVREQILCQKVKPPPPSVDPTPPDPDPTLTTRERFREHTEDVGCFGCHKTIDAIGFGFENYDHLGRFRADEYGLPVDASGAVIDANDPAIEGTFDGALELSAKLAHSDQVRNCLATQWYRYAMGRVETQADLCSVRQAATRFSESKGDLVELLVGLTLTDAFRYRVPTQSEGAP